MYLITLYFDDETNERIQKWMYQIYKKVGNDSMLNIPAHLTLASFYCDEKRAIEIFNNIEVKEIDLECVSIGFFLPATMFIQPILSKELESLMNEVHKQIDESTDRYKPYHWIPHITLCKYLKNDSLGKCLEAIQNEFKPFKAKVEKIGLAKSNPYKDIYTKDM